MITSTDHNDFNDIMEMNRTFHKKTQKTRSDTAVQGTNDSSIVSKLSAVIHQYTEDDYLKYAVKKPCRRAPLINRGYYIRAKAMDHVFQSFLKYYRNLSQIVNLGAGFDMSYFRLCHQGLLHNCTYFEVDFPDVMNRKSNLIQSQPQLLSLLNDVKLQPSVNIVLASSKYKLLGVDLTVLELLNTTLAAAGFDACVPTLFVSEVVLCYMAPASSSKVIEWAAATVKHGVFLTYEQIYPDDAFGRVMMKHFETIGSHLRTIRDFPTIHDQICRYQNEGWVYTKAMDMNYFFTEDERRRVYHLEPFDEFEEWHLKCTHYMVLTAFCGDCIQFAEHVWMCSQVIKPETTKLKETPVSDANTQDNIGDQLKNDAIHLQICCGDVVNCRNEIGQQKHDLQIPGDMYVWQNVFDEQASVGSYNKRFGHTCNLMIPIDNSDSHNATVKQQNASCSSENTEVSSSNHHLSSEKRSRLIPDEFLHYKTSYDELSYILCVGGFGKQNNEHRRLSTLSAVLPGSDNATEVHCSGDPCSFDRMYHTANNISGHRLVIFGGRFSPIRPCDTRSVYVLSCVRAAGNQFSCHCQVNQITGVNPCPRWRHSALNIKWQDRECILVYGGRTEDYSTLNDLHLLSIDTWTWSKVEPEAFLPQGTHSHTAELWRKSMLIIGGLNEDEVATNIIYQLNIPQTTEDNWVWSKLNLAGKFTRASSSEVFYVSIMIYYSRYSHTSTVVGDRLFVIGGVSMCNPPPGVSVIDLLSKNVQEYRQLQLQSDPITMLQNHASVQLFYEDRTDIYIIGGGGNCFSFGTHLNDSPILFSVKHNKNK